MEDAVEVIIFDLEVVLVVMEEEEEEEEEVAAAAAAGVGEIGFIWVVGVTIATSPSELSIACCTKLHILSASSNNAFASLRKGLI